MKRLCAVFLLLFAMVCPAGAAEVSGPVALTFEEYCPQVIGALEEAGAKGTFFLRGVSREEAGRLLGGKHEIGVDLSREARLPYLSRREIYGCLRAAMEGLPGDYRPRWLLLPENPGDAPVQVADATGFSLAGRSVDARKGLTPVLVDQVRSGDIIALGTVSPEELREFLGILRLRQLQPVTLSELARLRGGRVRPGMLYEKFPAGQGGEGASLLGW